MAAPSAQEQLMLELINRARLNPAAEAARLGIDLNANLAPGTISTAAKDPLAFNFLLIDSSRAHSQWMLDTDVFNHTGINGSNPQQRMEAAGYVFGGAAWWNGENISWSGTSGTVDLTAMIRAQHDSLFRSAGHRANIESENFTEIGIGQRQGQFLSQGTNWNASMVTQNFATTGGRANFLTGVVYNDTTNDDFYGVGEGVGGVTVSIAGGGSTTTYGSGGYDLMNVTGRRDVTFSGGGLAAAVTVTVDTGDGNVKLDLVDGTHVRSSSSYTALGTGAVSLELLGAATFGYGNNVANVITGTDGVNTMRGNGGNDQIFGRGGNDLLIGDSGNDTLDGGDGTDFLRGGSGNDSLIGGNGIDYADYRNHGSSVVVNLATGTSTSTNAAWGSDTFIQVEGAYGSSFDDTLTGGTGGDRLFGEAGSDSIDGGAGNDRIWGGFGRDFLRGGTGADTFLFWDGHTGGTAATRDVILDFSRTEGDRIDLSSIDANTGVAGNQAFVVAASLAAAQATAGSLFIGTEAGKQVVFLNLDADADFEMSIEVNGTTPLLGSDFIL